MLLWLATHPLVLFAPLFGAAFASFLTVVAERLPRGDSLGGRSRCACGRPLAAFDGWRPQNVPVLGWLAARGTARCCGARLPRLYLVNELVLAAGFTAVAGWSPGWLLAVLVLLAQCLALTLWSVNLLAADPDA